MPKQVQLRRGTTVQHASFTGAIGEVTVDTTKKVGVVHDGSTVGGLPLSSEAAVTALTARVAAFGVLPYLSDGVIALHDLVRVGSDSGHVTPGTIASNNTALGIAQNATTGAGQAVSVALFGLAREAPLACVANSAITAGAFVELSATAGRLQALTGSIGTHLVVGIARTGAAVAGDFFDLLPGVWQKII